MTTSGTPTPPNQFTVPGSTGASIPLVAEPAVDRNASMGALVKDVTTHMSTLVRSEIELAKLEITETVKTGATGGAFFAVAGVIGAFSLFFFWFMVAWILAIWLPSWAAFTIVFFVMVLIAGAVRVPRPAQGEEDQEAGEDHRLPGADSGGTEDGRNRLLTAMG